MKSKLAVVVVGPVSLALSACSSGSGSGPSGTPTRTSSSSPAAPTAADLKLATSLLQQADLPKGYGKDAVTRGTGIPVSVGDVKCAQQFSRANRLDTGTTVKPAAHARVSFSKGASGPFIRELALRYVDTVTAAKVMAAVHTVDSTCSSFIATNPVTKAKVTITLTPLTAPHLGDEAVATGAQLTSAGKGVLLELVLIRTGASVAVVDEIASASPDFGALQRATQAAVRRLAAAK